MRDVPISAFSFVMATGIVSIGLDHAAPQVSPSGFATLGSLVLLVVASVAFLVLLAVTIWRMCVARPSLRDELRDPRRAFGAFAVVAAANVLAVRVAADVPAAAVGLLALSAGAWLLLTVIVPRQLWRHPLGGARATRGATGNWFLAAVGSQSIAVALTAIPTTGRADDAPWVAGMAACFWVLGLAQYAVIAALVVVRLVRHRVTAGELDPSYWIAMGAIAIAVVAGVGLLEFGLPRDPWVDRAVTGAVVLACWAACVCLIPVLLVAGVWRHLFHRVPLRYEPMLWAMVFPLGMFADATMGVARSEELSMLWPLGVGTLGVALLVWLLVCGAGVTQTVRRVFAPRN